LANQTQNADYATFFGTVQEANTAIQKELWDNLLELAPKREKSDKVRFHLWKFGAEELFGNRTIPSSLFLGSLALSLLNSFFKIQKKPILIR
jgi:hypothetical protein